VTSSTPFRYVRDAALVPRPSTPFRYVRDAALVPRPSTPFRYVRGAPIVIPPLPSSPLVLVKVTGRPYYQEASGVVQLVAPSVDLTIQGEVIVGIVPAGVSLIITEAIVVCTAAANVSSPASVGIGITASDGDIFPIQQLVALLVADDMYRFPVVGTGSIAGPGSIIRVGVGVAATGASVSQTASVELIGYRLRS